MNAITAAAPPISLGPVSFDPSGPLGIYGNWMYGTVCEGAWTRGSKSAEPHL